MFDSGTDSRSRRRVAHRIRQRMAREFPLLPSGTLIGLERGRYQEAFFPNPRVRTSCINNFYEFVLTPSQSRGFPWPEVHSHGVQRSQSGYTQGSRTRSRQEGRGCFPEGRKIARKSVLKSAVRVVQEVLLLKL